MGRGDTVVRPSGITVVRPSGITVVRPSGIFIKGKRRRSHYASFPITRSSPYGDRHKRDRSRHSRCAAVPVTRSLQSDLLPLGTTDASDRGFLRWFPSSRDHLPPTRL